MTNTPARFYNMADKGRMPSNIRPASNYVNVYAVSAAGTATVTVPSATVTNVSGGTQTIPASFAIFSADANFYAVPNGTASAATATNGSGSELNPAAWGLNLTPDGLNPVTTIGLYSTPGANVTIAFYLQD